MSAFYKKGKKWLYSLVWMLDFGASIIGKCEKCNDTIRIKINSVCIYNENASNILDETYIVCSSCYKTYYYIKEDLTTNKLDTNKNKENQKDTTLITESMRYDCWNRYEDNTTIGKCFICYDILSYQNFDTAYIKSRHNGGDVSVENLRPTHPLCNRSMKEMKR